MNIKTDSRKVKPGDTFIAIRGFNHDGHDYIADAIRSGASKVVVEHGSYEVETEVVADTMEYLKNYLKEHLQEKLEKMKIIGITGTNGKTTTCFLFYQAFNQLNRKCAYIGTLGFYLDGKERELDNTTPDLLSIYEMLEYAFDHGCECVVMEVSSHALDMNRIGDLMFDVGVFTNLTQDHLDYHLDMKHYALAKQKLFYHVKPDGISLVNADDPYCHYFNVHPNTISYGIENGDKKIDRYQLTSSGTTFQFEGTTYETQLLGKYNLYNIFVVLLLLEHLGYQKQIKEVLSNLLAPAGRMERIPYRENQIIVDYAHTPDAVKNILSTFRQLHPSHIITIIGCGGNRDKGKRPIMGEIATSLSDFVIFTSDNPREEDPMDILHDIVSNLDKKNYKICENRAFAIREGIQMLKKDDILLVLGKGHETYQMIGREKIHMSDIEMIRDFIK